MFSPNLCTSMQLTLFSPILSTLYLLGLFPWLYEVCSLRNCSTELLCVSLYVLDRQVQLERGDAAAQELVNSLQVLEVMAGAMARELKPLV